MPKLFHAQYEDEFEAEGFFDEKGKMLQGWHGNDANWRGEYMDPLLEKLGYEVVYSSDPKLKKKLKKAFGG